MKYLFYLIFSKIGIVFSGSGSSRLNKAISAFTEAQKELRVAAQHELKSINKKDAQLAKAKKEFEKKEKKLKDQTEAHKTTRKQSLKYIDKIEKFLDIDDADDGVDEVPAGLCDPKEEARSVDSDRVQNATSGLEKNNDLADVGDETNGKVKE